MSLDFDKYAAKGNEIINKLSEELSVPRDNAGRIMRAVLRALRNRLTAEESFNLMAQLPMALKGVYADGWMLNKPYNRIHHLTEFIAEVRDEDGKTGQYDFANDELSKHAIKAVFKTVFYYVSKGEADNILAVLPAELKQFVKNSIRENNTVL